ncbi:MAG: rhomboid family intramembrane serine protease [Corynebacterium sp.]|nr:rhomboid family intramembrane serine protease [Corynebacterium sp.]
MTKTLKILYRQAPATTIICLLIIVTYLITALQSHSFVDNLQNSSLAEHMVLSMPAMESSPLGPLRSIGTLFLHQGADHLIVNTVMLFLIGREIERSLGHAIFTGTFFTGGLGSSALVSYLQPYVPTVGASGAIFSLMVLLIGVAALKRMDLRAPIIYVLINVAFSFISPGVSWAGHMGGFGIGVVLLLAIRRSLRFLKRVLYFMLIALIIVMLWLVYSQPGLIHSFL